MLQPQRHRPDDKTKRMNGASQRSQPPAVISQVVLCAIEIQLELFDLHIVGVRFTENLLCEMDNRSRRCIVFTKWSSKGRNSERHRAMLDLPFHGCPIDRRSEEHTSELQSR